ncbi:reverse transcriptase [Caerostris extrusa]|uniref:Reverse transcriptase n=1 Tax=Caerostris extrusa TaxID=172846 RepID=A0AAV4NXB9_CAEEX|nr:reverse transcriptase [Caerostris extrusa]
MRTDEMRLDKIRRILINDMKFNYCGIPIIKIYAVIIKLQKRRLFSLSKTLERNKEIYLKYDDVFKEHIREDILEQVDMNLDQNADTRYFLPHNSSVREQKDTTTVRIVFDASYKIKRIVIKRLFR